MKAAHLCSLRRTISVNLIAQFRLNRDQVRQAAGACTISEGLYNQPVRLSVGGGAGAVVGVLIEVPVMLSVVRLVNRSQTWYERNGGRRERALPLTSRLRWK